MAGEPIGERFDEIDQLMAVAIDNIHELSHEAASFVHRTIERLDRYGQRTLFTEKELAFAAAINTSLASKGLIDDDGEV